MKNSKKKNNYKFDDKAINSGLLSLFLVGCLVLLLVGGHALTIVYSNMNKDNTITSDQMQIKTNDDNIDSYEVDTSVAEDGEGTATIVE